MKPIHGRGDSLQDNAAFNTAKVSSVPRGTESGNSVASLRVGRSSCLQPMFKLLLLLLLLVSACVVIHGFGMVLGLCWLRRIRPALVHHFGM